MLDFEETSFSLQFSHTGFSQLLSGEVGVDDIASGCRAVCVWLGLGHMAAVGYVVETAVCRPVTKDSGDSEFCLATGWIELSSGPWSMGCH